MSASLVTTQRTHGQLRSTLARVALAASQIDAYYQRSLGVAFVSGLSGFCGWRKLRFAVALAAPYLSLS